MAGKSGIDVLRGLKAIDARIEIIMLTAYETIETARQALRLGACDYLSKRFDLSTIREARGPAPCTPPHLRNRHLDLRTPPGLQRCSSNDTTLKEEMARTTTEIYAGALHDINNPLTVIIGYVDLLRHRLEHTSSLSGPEAPSHHARRRRSPRQSRSTPAPRSPCRYLRFVNLLQLPRPGDILISQVLDDVQTLMRNHPSLRGGKLVVNPLGQDAAALIGGTELIQILLNLAVNAFQSTSQAQTVTIDRRAFRRPTLPIEKLARTARANASSASSPSPTPRRSSPCP